jgi:hypothetical protein
LPCSRANLYGEQKQLRTLNVPALSDGAPHNHVLHISTDLARARSGRPLLATLQRHFAFTESHPPKRR